MIIILNDTKAVELQAISQSLEVNEVWINHKGTAQLEDGTFVTNPVNNQCDVMLIASGADYYSYIALSEADRMTYIKNYLTLKLL